MKKIIVDTSVLEQKLDNLHKAFKKDAKEILYRVVMLGAEVAAKFTPPPNGKTVGGWSKKIPKDSYKRNKYFIPTILKNNLYPEVHPQLRQKWKEGFKFVVFKIKKGKKIEKMYFGKNEKEIKRFEKISFRGLLKAVWGLQLLRHGRKSNLFNGYLRKSPMIRNLSHLNKLMYVESHGQFRMVNVNKAITSQTLADSCCNNQKRPIKRKLKAEVKKWHQNYFSSGKL